MLIFFWSYSFFSLSLLQIKSTDLFHACGQVLDHEEEVVMQDFEVWSIMASFAIGDTVTDRRPVSARMYGVCRGSSGPNDYILIRS